ncbi:SDR family oxidoreductase [Micromonospora sp. ATA51]|uniref:SDR family NAD(P)-dependent oxidoreductase n=1 Tax=Micromonospora sp. ATA51 TaxID=2806098 RepID=UPI001A3A72EE|nr:SDR family NAD(P)-dependent oxidoreductase [Micromonospora sp. ATA51]MBM0224588.1 SDR family NAD(P)-dependent oxidoreductase [Micromonospora sp. ATA51]
MNKLALVTGATSGIGKAFAERLAADGYDLVIAGRRKDRLDEFAASHPEAKVQIVAADLSTDAGVDTIADVCASEPLTMLVNNAGVSHYMPLAELPADKARELVHVKVVAPTMLSRAAVAGMQQRGEGTIINVAGMIAFSGPAPSSVMPRRAVYAGTLAHLVAMSQTLSAELEGTGVKVQVVCPGVVTTEFHERQGLDMSVVPRMSADDVVTASLRGLELGEVVVAPGVEDAGLLDAVFQADLAMVSPSPRRTAVYQTLDRGRRRTAPMTVAPGATQASSATSGSVPPKGSSIGSTTLICSAPDPDGTGHAEPVGDQFPDSAAPRRRPREEPGQVLPRGRSGTPRRGPGRGRAGRHRRRRTPRRSAPARRLRE